MPVMVSMQFEDAMSQRLQHIVAGWAMIMDTTSKEEYFDAEGMGATIGSMMSSVKESELFYREVMKR